ncbi:SRA stem-loop-interacting RNA-binding protein, mitochondrial-like [Acropora muricata]|uniref:SRA stem-loop-interacting RNA-binding protein, mitochondrial-like n=1 Tax=Acropora millepora TaxID=45264 RepID=UPI0010FCC7C5|nr:SRA stem-loop-interacting RNA-binding protein, mitochondrial-like [Acropora millepora]
MATSRIQIFVAKLPWTACANTMREYFQQYGPVSSSRVIFDYYSGRSKKYGFVEFEHSETLDKVLAEPVHMIDGKQVHIQSKVHSQQTRHLPLADNRTHTNQQPKLDYSEV